MQGAGGAGRFRQEGSTGREAHQDWALCLDVHVGLSHWSCFRGSVFLQAAGPQLPVRASSLPEAEAATSNPAALCLGPNGMRCLCERHTRSKDSVWGKCEMSHPSWRY